MSFIATTVNGQIYTTGTRVLRIPNPGSPHSPAERSAPAATSAPTARLRLSNLPPRSRLAAATRGQSALTDWWEIPSTRCQSQPPSGRGNDVTLSYWLPAHEAVLPSSIGRRASQIKKPASGRASLKRCRISVDISPGIGRFY